MISKLLEEYEAATEDEVKDFSRDQLRIWRRGRIRAIERFAEVAGDKPINEVTADDAIDYCEWWRDRVVDDKVEAKTALRRTKPLASICYRQPSFDQCVAPPVNYRCLRLRGGSGHAG
jgi:hypothetical protein